MAMSILVLNAVAVRNYEACTITLQTERSEEGLITYKIRVVTWHPSRALKL